MNKMKKRIYVDHAATTQLFPEALEAMLPYLKNKYGNPSTLYSFAREPHKAVEESRKKIAEIIGADENCIYFTSGGTESDNWALKSIAFQYLGKRKRIITSSIEHHAILNTCKFLEKLGFEIVYLPVKHDGTVSVKELSKAINTETILISIMMANNEIGTIQNIFELAQEAHKYKIIFHTDAVQAIGHIPVNIKELGVDMLSASAHKFGGPKGIGFLYVSNRIKLNPYIDGGGQEKGMRSGTENVASIVGMKRALEISIDKIDDKMEYLSNLSKHFVNDIKNVGLSFIINGSNNRIPGSISISFKDVEGEMLLHRLDLKGICVSTGSACNSKNTELSHVLKAIDINRDYAFGTIRITLGLENTLDDIKYIVKTIKEILSSKCNSIC